MRHKAAETLAGPKYRLCGACRCVLRLSRPTRPPPDGSQTTGLSLDPGKSGKGLRPEAAESQTLTESIPPDGMGLARPGAMPLRGPLVEETVQKPETRKEADV